MNVYTESLGWTDDLKKSFYSKPAGGSLTPGGAETPSYLVVGVGMLSDGKDGDDVVFAQ